MTEREIEIEMARLLKGMKMYSGRKVEVEVRLFSDKYYAIYYREKKRFNLFNRWERYSYTFYCPGVSIDFNQPRLYENFDEAVEIAKSLKSNPSLIDKNNWEKLEDYQKFREEDLERHRKLNKVFRA